MKGENLRGENRRPGVDYGGPRAVSPIERIERRCTYEDRGYLTPCRIYHGAKHHNGYGAISIGSRKDESKKNRRTHRLAWERIHGAVPEGLELDHLCNQRDCCEVTHLEAVTRAENNRRRSERMSYNEIVDKTPAAGGMTAWAPGQEPVAKKRSTRYEIQTRYAEPSDWRSTGVVEATSARGAIREWWDKGPDVSAPIVVRAIPIRNITQVTVDFKTQMQLTFS